MTKLTLKERLAMMHNKDNKDAKGVEVKEDEGTNKEDEQVSTESANEPEEKQSAADSLRARLQAAKVKTTATDTPLIVEPIVEPIVESVDSLKAKMAELETTIEDYAILEDRIIALEKLLNVGISHED